MRFPAAEIQRLLSEQFEHIESIWDASPYDEVNVYALTIKEFMRDRALDEVEEGLRQFVAFKAEQARQLAALGLGGGETLPDLPCALQPATQAA